MASEPYWRPDRHADRRPFLLRRNEIKARLRRYFDAQGFLEVECGALQVSPGNEAHLHAFAADRLGEDGAVCDRLYLHTSPEFACKKLLAAGEKRIVDFARVYRNREAGPLHASEFTMVEWYRVAEPYDAVMDDCVALCRLAAGDGGRLAWRDQVCDPHAKAERLPMVEAFARHAGIDLEDCLGDRNRLAAAARSAGVRVGDDDLWSDIFSRILVERIEPKLGQGRLTILDRYPLCEAALASPQADDARFAERFELYACGVELANGFGELTDADEQRRRFDAEMTEKARVYGERYPLDEEFLAALTIMSPASGVALGFERLVMLATGARHIRDVLWTPID